MQRMTFFTVIGLPTVVHWEQSTIKHESYLSYLFNSNTSKKKYMIVADAYDDMTTVDR